MARQIDFGIGRPQRLLLEAALSADKDRGAAALAEWWAGVSDLNEVRGTDSSLFAQIYANLGSRIEDPALAARMRGTARHVWVRNNYMMADCAGITAALARIGIPVMLLKGAAMAVAVDRGAAVRWMSDCDILLPLERAREAVAALAAAGLTERQDLAEEDLRLVHGLTLRDGRTGRDRIDIHWQPVRNIGTPTLAREMLAAGRPARIGEADCHVPRFEHMVFHTIIHGTEWAPFPRYDWLVDTAKILRRAGADFDWPFLRRTARTYRFGFLIAAALAEARRHVPALVPAGAEDGLVDGPTPLERREAAIRLSKPSSRTRADAVILAVQQERRSSDEALRKPVLASAVRLYRSLNGPPPPAPGPVAAEGGIAFLHGWSAPQPGGRWTDGPEATLILRHAGGRPPQALAIRAQTLLAPQAAPQVVRFRTGMRTIGSLSWWTDGPAPVSQMLALPANAWRNDAMVLRLAIARPVAPAELPGSNHDSRALGIFLEEIRLVPERHDLLSEDISLTSDAALPFLWHGWSLPEWNGRWTSGRLAVLRWRNAGAIPPGHSLLVDLVQRVPGVRHVTGSFAIDGRRHRFDYSADRTLPATVALPLDAHAAEDAMELRITIDKPTAPADVIGGGDTRPLGLMVAAVRIAPTPSSR